MIKKPDQIILNSKRKKMLTIEKIKEYYGNGITLGDSIFKFQEDIGDVYQLNYLYHNYPINFIVNTLSENDDVVLSIFDKIVDIYIKDQILKIEFCLDRFTHILLVPSDYHPFLSYVFNKPYKLIDVIPIFNCEFSDDETIEEFNSRIEWSIDVEDWNREKSPKIFSRYSIKKSGKRSIGKKYIPTIFDHVKNNIHELSGDHGFVELYNFKRECVIINSPDKNVFQIENISYNIEELLEFLSNFLQARLIK